MDYGFDSKQTHALVVYGYPLDGLTYAQCVDLAKAVHALGGQLVAAPNGDLTESGTPNATTPDETTCFTFLVGALAAEMSVRSRQGAKGKATKLGAEETARAEAEFERAQAKLDALLAEKGVTPAKAPGLFVLAAGPLASATLEGKEGTMIERIDADGEREELGSELTVSYDADPDAVQVHLQGTFKLSARYD
ncbi:hypothetical protein [Chondromyces crocatus]|uniref:Uncharacterized protein n=1 Tax=Chondromyces crocatus TaxID=52 RepID=A0A0K1EPC5_CHOCO|nr:hypothetical protein [Chondromyces crocatus]AKT42473.1 uncharacterized protein CMC5_066990 [Chondromyces crocatus]